MRRGSVTQIKIAAIGALLWAAAMLLPVPPEARAQSAFVPHFDVRGAAIRSRRKFVTWFCGAGTSTGSSSAWLSTSTSNRGANRWPANMR